MVALPLPVIDAVVTMKLTDLAPAWTVTDGSTVNAGLEFERVTIAPPVGAARVRLTVQMLEEFDPTLLGLHEMADTATDEVRPTAVLAEVPL
jgi:hypothetical protein